MDSLDQYTPICLTEAGLGKDYNHLAALIQIFADFSRHRNADLLMQKMLALAIKSSSCEGGTIYSATNKNTLQFQCFINNALFIREAHEKPQGSFGSQEIPLYDATGIPNHQHLCTHVYHEKKLLHIEDAYTTKDYECKGIREFDRKNSYRTISILTVPIFANNQDVIGIMQLINARNPKTSKPTKFHEDTQKIIGALATICGFQMDNLQLIDKLNTQIEANRCITLEKDRLLRDLHDGIGSQLTKASIGLQSGLLSPADSIKLIDDAIEEMNHIFENYLNFESSLHRMIELIVEQYARIFKSQKGCEISYRLINPKAAKSYHPKDLILNLMQVLREILTNSLKYSPAKSLEIILSIEKTLVNLTICENGLVQPPPEPSIPQGRGFGHKNILYRIEFVLNGKIKFSREQNAYLISISIPSNTPQLSRPLPLESLV
jgi:signal transduction histidine kinase